MLVTNGQGSAFSNQKKIVRRSGGQLIALVNETGVNGKLFFSDDEGHTWLDFFADIGGLTNGSVGLYTDAGGVEHIVVVWKQSGTANGRIDGACYIVVGDFVSGLGASVQIATPGGLFLNYPDLVVHPEGSGGVAHVALSYNNGTQCYAIYQPISIAGNVATPGTYTTLGGDYASSNHSFPSIDFNPVTKNLFCTWSAGATGAGKGIRFKKATYSAGAWTWGTEREIDNTCYVLNSDYAVICRWDAINSLAIIGLVLGYTGSILVQKIYQRDAADTTTTLLLFDSAVVNYHCNGTMVVIPNGDIYLFGSGHSVIVGAGQTPLTYRKLTRISGTALSDAGFVNFTFGDQRWVNGIYSANKIHLVYTGGNNSPYQVRYDRLAV